MNDEENVATEEFDFQESEAQKEPKPQLQVYVNAGFGKKSHVCRLNEDCTMALPDKLIRELNYNAYEDKLEWEFDESEGVLYVRVVEDEWEAPDWIGD